MSDWQDWDGDGKVDDTERAFTYFMIDDMNKRAQKNGGGCLGCIMLFLVVSISVFRIII